MRHLPGRRVRVALTATATAFSLALLVPGAAHAADGTPNTPTDLYNANEPCSTDPAAPVFSSSGWAGRIEAITGSTDPAVTRLTAQFRSWPVTDPTQVATVENTWARPGWEALATFNPAAGTTYAWQARTVDPASGAASDWTASCYVTADDTAPSAAPVVSTPGYPDGQWAPGGAPIEYRLDPNGVADVAGYQYSFRGDFYAPYVAHDGDHGIPVLTTPYNADPPYGVRADYVGGPATVRLTPPAGMSSGPVTLSVRSLDRAGNPGPAVQHRIFISPTPPTVTQLSHSPLFGKPVTFRFDPNPGVQAISPVTSYTVKNTRTGTTTVVPAGADGSAETTLLLNSPLGDLLDVTSTSANGWISSAGQWGGYLDTSPTITSTDFPEDGAGTVGTPGVFHLAPKISGSQIASYTYSFDWGAHTATVPAGAHGEADLTYTPTESGWGDLYAWATTKDGVNLTAGDYSFTVN
ncbi:hypothetical protein ACFV1L_04200 [Kitasatospora sp. NPDC059646]|uniref:hypothetical protein n=1 Tax=Kitasatospora sp. NPDC059646 TaxID=3346893 RepID=UPI0036C55376